MNYRLRKLLGFTLIFVALTGCKIGIDVPVGGKVITESGSYDCQSGKVCTIDVYDAFFDETFIAVPDSGYVFSGWKQKDSSFCGGKYLPCHLVTTGFPGHVALMAVLESDTVFHLEPVFANTWSRVGENIVGEATGDRSGYSVSMSSNGKRLAIGAPEDRGNSSHIGRVRVYRWSDNAWQQLGADIDGKADRDHFGSSVSISGDGSRLAIGAARIDERGWESGLVRVYVWSGTAWEQLGGDINDKFSGRSVSLSADGNRVAIGARYNEGNAQLSGRVRVYEWRGKAWQQVGGDIDGKAAAELFGGSVSLSAKGNKLAIGAYANDDNGDKSGAARVYVWSGTSWQQLGNDINGAAPYDWFGISVSLSTSGNRLAIGTGQADYVRVYAWSGTNWTQLGSDINAETTGTRFGYSVSLSADGRRLAIGAEWDDDNGRDAGQARVYAWSGSDWRQLLGDINGETKSQYFGTPVSLSRNGSRVAAGAPNAPRGGYVGVYEMSYAEAPPPSVDPMKVYLLSPEHVEQIPQNNPATGCSYHPLAGYGLLMDFDWSDAKSPVGIAGYHLRVIGGRASQPLIDTFVTNSDYLSIHCDSYVTNFNASIGFDWTVQAEDNSGNLGPVNDEGVFGFQLCRLNNGDPCGEN